MLKQFEIPFKTKKDRNDFRSVMNKLYALKNRDLPVEQRYDVLLRVSKIGDKFRLPEFYLENSVFKFFHMAVSVSLDTVEDPDELANTVDTILITRDFIEQYKNEPDSDIILLETIKEGQFVFTTVSNTEPVFTEMVHSDFVSQGNHGVWPGRVRGSLSGESYVGTVVKAKSQLNESNELYFDKANETVRVPSILNTLMSAESEIHYALLEDREEGVHSKVVSMRFNINKYSKTNTFIMRVHGEDNSMSVTSCISTRVSHRYSILPWVLEVNFTIPSTKTVMKSHSVLLWVWGSTLTSTPIPIHS